MGATLNTSVAGTNKGVFMNGEGDFLLYGSSTNYFKFDASANSIDIKSDTFDLDATTIIMDSATQNGKIALGATPPTTISGSSKGFYVDGKGQLLIGDASLDNLKFDGTNMTVSSSLMVSGSMTIGTANSGSADPDSYLAVGKVSDPWTNTSGIEMRKDYFANFRMTYGQMHPDKSGAGVEFQTECNG